MNLAATASMTTLSGQLLPSISQSWLRQISLAFAGSLLLTLSAKISIPFYPVPLTLQTLVVLLIGFSMGSRLAALTVGLYLLEGAFGLPVFAGTPIKGIGLAYMTGPTGGYLAGFLVAAIICGKLAEKGWDRRPVTTLSGMLIGTLIIYICGLTWLATFIGWGEKVFQLGLIPFLAGDLLKIVIAMIALPWAWKKINQNQQ